MITVEEGSIGGFGEHVSRFLLGANLLGGGLKLKFSPMGLPDRWARIYLYTCTQRPFFPPHFCPFPPMKGSAFRSHLASNRQI